MKLRAHSLLATLLMAAAPSLLAEPSNQWRIFTRTDGLADNACISVTLGASGNVLVRHARSAAVSVLDGYEITTLPGPGLAHSRVYESPGGQLWSVAPGGLQEFRDDQWVTYRLPDIATHFQSGRTNEIQLLPVRQGRVLVLLPDQLLQFEAEDPERPRVVPLRHADQTQLGAFRRMKMASDGALWIAGARGFEMNPGPVRNLRPDDVWSALSESPPEFAPVPRDANLADELSVRKVFEVVVESGGALWVATSEGLFRRAPQLWTTTQPASVRSSSKAAARPASELDAAVLRDLPESVSSRGPWRVSLLARNGDLWLGGGYEIAWRHRDAWRFFASTNQIGPENVLAFAEAADGRIWCATPNQVWEFDGRNWMVLRGGFDRINSLCCARDGTLWVAAEDGAYRYAQGEWISNGPEDGLPSPVVLAISEDPTGRILATTAKGAATFRPESDTEPPHTLIQTEPEEEPNFREGGTVTLTFRGRDKWKQTSAHRLLFSHRLDEREWSVFQEFRDVSFTDLPLGKHYFQVRAMDRNGNIDPRPARFEFSIIVPWYRETRLVLILSCALGVALFFAALAMNRHRRLRLSYAEVERTIAKRTHELELANRELLQSQKMNALGTLSAGIAHDFNNILSIVKGSAQIIEDNLENPDKIRTRLDRIKTVVQQGAGIVEAMLGFSRSSDREPGASDVNLVVADTLKLLGDRFLREIEVKFERSPRLPEIAVARDFVQQVLLNFIFNAAEAMERRSPERPESNPPSRPRADQEIGAPATRRKQIRLATSVATSLPPDIFLTPASADSYILISVRDHGSGIAPEIKSRIFEPFFTTKALSAKRGTGLGLSMVYELTKKMEAGLAVESVVGEGSTFTLILPVRHAETGSSQKKQLQHVATS